MALPGQALESEPARPQELALALAQVAWAATLGLGSVSEAEPAPAVSR
jgi:hypothetical protein